jgi:hypothetical protein
VIERYCKDCERRKGIKNGKLKFIYDIGDAPCRACVIDDMIDELENAPTVDAEPVVRCKDCKYYYVYNGHNFCDLDIEMMRDLDPNYYCASAERKEDDEIQHP